MSRRQGTAQRGCVGKLAHKDQVAALRHVAGLIRAGAHRSSVNAYQCKHCGRWHVGHHPGPRRLRR